jgi:hypothetical protein
LLFLSFSVGSREGLKSVCPVCSVCPSSLIVAQYILDGPKSTKDKEKNNKKLISRD